MVQTPNLVTGQVVKQPETDLIIAAIRAWSTLVKDLLLAQLNAVVPGGFALSAATGTPIKVNYAQGVVILSGYDIAVPAGSLTLAAADPTYHRYDLLTIAYSQTSPADSAGQPSTLDTATPSVVEGAASATPVIPNLPANSVYIGWVDVPPGVTTASQCTINPLLGPLAPNNLQDLTNHLPASMASAVVHGFQATTAGGTQANRLAQTNSLGAVGAAQTVVDGGGVARQVAVPGAATAFQVCVLDASGRAPDSNKLLGHSTGSGNGLDADTVDGSHATAFDAAGTANAVQANLNGHAASTPKTATGVHGLVVDDGIVAAQTVPNQGYADFTVPLTYAQPDANYVPDAGWLVPAPFTVGYGGTTQIWNRTTTSFQVRVTQNSGASQSIGLAWKIMR